MVKALNDALMEIQGALLARSLYPENHPRIRVSEDLSFGMLTEVLRDEEEVTLFALDGRVVYDGEILPSCANLADTLFRMLKANGVDQITFRRGLSRKEIRALLDALVDCDHGRGSQLKNSTHIGLGSLRGVDPAAEDREAAGTKSSAVLYAEQVADVLPGLWQDLGEFYKAYAGDPNKPVGAIDLEQLGEIVSSVSRVVANSSSAMVPLAPLKRHDEYTFVHTINVAILSTSLGEALGLDSETVKDLNIAALLHDVGKQAVPKEILNKRGRFTEKERAVMEIHPVEGARMLLNMPGVPDLASIVAYEHHIRADGSGYPKVPGWWKVNLASRIVQVADVFDALRTDRPYRQGLPVPKIVEMMRNDVGTFFDGDLLQVFFERVVSRGIPEPATSGALPA